MFKKDPKKKEQKRLNRALLDAAVNGKPADIVKLLAEGAEIETKGGFWANGLTPLNLAAWNGNTETVRCLLEQGAFVNTRDDSGDTPVRNAAIRGNTLAVALLMQHGADPAMTNSSGDSALSCASDDDRQDLVDIMMGKTIVSVSPGKNAAAAPETIALPAPETPAVPPSGHNPDEVVFRRRIGDKTLEEIFNFAEKERVTLVRAGENGPVEAITREDFSTLQEKPSLRRAFEEYARRGGTIPESDIFQGELAKIKPLQRGPG